MPKKSEVLLSTDDCRSFRIQQLFTEPYAGAKSRTTKFSEPSKLESIAKFNETITIPGGWCGLPMTVAWYEEGSWLQVGTERFVVEFERQPAGGQRAYVKHKGTRRAQRILLMPDDDGVFSIPCTKHSASLKPAVNVRGHERSRVIVLKKRLSRLLTTLPSDQWLKKNIGVAPPWIRYKELKRVRQHTINVWEDACGLPRTMKPQKKVKPWLIQIAQERERDVFGRFLPNENDDERDRFDLKLNMPRNSRPTPEGKIQIPQIKRFLKKFIKGGGLHRTSQKKMARRLIKHDQTLTRSERKAAMEFFGLEW